uniref:NTR domain-containing protein n=1 Tax=Steinernema glaseri TaxID=37863 RepID=A0A1I7ZIV3_9BILA
MVISLWVFSLSSNFHVVPYTFTASPPEINNDFPFESRTQTSSSATIEQASQQYFVGVFKVLQRNTYPNNQQQVSYTVKVVKAFRVSDSPNRVGVFKVLQRNTYPNNQQQVSYAVKVVKAFRAVYGVPTVGSTNLLFTQYSSAACGIEGLQNGTDYLLAGTASDGLKMNSCAQFEGLDWNFVPDDVKNALENGSYNPCN